MSESARAHASRGRRLFVCALLAALALSMLGAPPVAADATVTNCTQANLTSAIAGGGLVTLDCGAPTTISITTMLQIAANTELVGVGEVTLDGGGTTRVLFVQPGVALTLRNLTVANGFDASVGGGGVASQGALTVVDSAFTGNTTNALGGAIASASDDDVTLTNTTFSGNTASQGGAVTIVSVTQGGDTTLTVTNSSFEGNQATTTGDDDADGGAIFSVDAATIISGSAFSDNHATSARSSFGGALFASGATLTVSNSTFSDNSAASVGLGSVSSFGGAIFNGGDAVTITDSAFSGNGADATANADTGGASGFGGAIFNGSDELTIANSTLHDNHATATSAGDSASTFGGAIFNGSSNLTISNSTLSANRATSSAGADASSFGGAIFNGSTNLTLLNDTIVGNSASADADSSTVFGEAIFNGASTSTVANTIVLGGGGTACFGVTPAPPSGHNLASDTSCNFTAAGDQQNVTAAMLKLGPLQDNGGPTPTMLPGAGSLAIDAGDDAVCAAPPISGLDQRGHPRPFGAHCDVGAVEVGIAGTAQVRGIAVLRQSCGAQSATGFCLQWLIQLKVNEGSLAGITINAVVALPDGGQQQLSGLTDKAGGVKFTTSVNVYGTYTLAVTGATLNSTNLPLSGPLTRGIAIGGRFR